MITDLNEKAKLIFKKIENAGIEIKGYCYLLIFSFLASIFGGISNIILGFPPVSYITLFLGSIFIAISFIMLTRNKNERLIVESTMYYLCYVMIPALWFSSGGLRGATVYYCLVLVIVAPAFLKGIKRMLHPVLFICLVVSLIIYEYYHPEKVASYNSPEGRFMDIATNMAFTVLFLSYMIGILIKSYRSEHEKLVGISTHDDLTKVFNRRFMMDYIEDRISSSDAVENSCVVLIDFDDFKNINDTFGHLEGDRVIITVSHIISKKIGNSGKVGRIGGDEFIIFLENIKKQDLKSLCTEILETVYRNENISLSAGICFARKGQQLSELISCADKKLYSAKSRGKNCYEI